MNTEEITDAIESALKGIPKQFEKGANNPQYTRAVKLEVGRLGERLGYKVCGLKDQFDSEWLYDLCWYRSSEPEGRLLEVPLVLESEWDFKYKGIKYDFEKLLIAKSKFKVMVFQASGPTMAQYFKELEQGVRAYQGQRDGEIYLLACYDGSIDQFVI
jgi:hypothetical protein